MAGGRKLGFDKEEALDKAMRIFWKKGYVGTSLSDLTNGLGINKPSLYSAFGNKEQLFIQTSQHYFEKYAEIHSRQLSSEGSVKERLSRFLTSVISQQCSDDTPKGCYVSLCISESVGEMYPPEAAELIEEANHYSEKLLNDFLTAEQKKETISKEIDVTEVARYLTTFIHGTAAMARGGRNKEDLLSLVDKAVNIID